MLPFSFCGSFKTEGASRKRPFVCESAKLVGEAVALRLAQALFIEKGREAEYAPMIGQAESAGCGCTSFNGGDAGSQHGENAAGVV
ncbi:MAG: hypothetical protein ACLS6G_13970 [Christensenellales bacterium]